MADARRADVNVPAEIDAASQADALLNQGLDRYFDSRFEDAIHIWTRVLFLDRSHPRARAYIDRARSAIGERQRKSEEMLQASQQLLDRGDAAGARELFVQAVAASGEDERSAALRLNLDRAELVSAVLKPARLAIGPAPDVVPGWTWRRQSRELRGVLLLGAAAVFIYLVLGFTGAREWLGASPGTQRLAAPFTAAKPPVLSSSDVALIRARTLYSRGRLADALQWLDRVDDRSAVRTDADALRVEIQRLLLASGGQKR